MTRGWVCAVCLLAAFPLLTCRGQTGSQSGMGKGINFPGLVLRPYLDLRGTYDSDVWLSNPKGKFRYYQPQEEYEEEDYYFQGTVGLNMRNRADALRLSLDGWGAWNRYMEVTDRDNEEFGDRLNVGFGTRDNLDVNLYQRYSLADEYDHGPRGRETLEAGEALQLSTDPLLLDRHELTRRTMQDYGVKLGRRMSDKTDLDVAYIFSTTEFDRDELYDRDEHRLSGEVGWRATEKTALFLTVEGALQGSEGFADNDETLVARLGATTRSTEKLRFRAAVGASRYSYNGSLVPTEVVEPDDPRGEVDTRSDETTRLDFEVGGFWKPSERWTLDLIALSGYAPSAYYAANEAAQMVFSAALTYEVNRNWSLTGLGSFRRDDYLTEVLDEVDNEVIDKYIDLWSAGLRVAYKPDSFYTTYAEVKYTEADSNDPVSVYDVLQAFVGLSVWY